MIPQPVTDQLPELKPSSKGYLAIEREHWMPLARRCKGDLVLYAVVQLIYDDTESWMPKRPWCERSPSEFRQLTGASDRKILQVLKYAEKLGWISREESDNKSWRGRYRCHPDRFAETPLPPPRPRKQKKAKIKEAAVTVVRPMAALRILHSCAESVPRPAAVDPSIVHSGAESGPVVVDQAIPHSGAESTAFSSLIMHSHAESNGQQIMHSYAESLPRFAESGTVVCPIGLVCPYSVNDLQATKQLETVETVETTTTTTAAPPADAGNVVVVVSPSIVLEELQEHGAVTPKTGLKLVSDCRRAFPEATEEEIVAVIRKLAAGFGRGTVNPVGVLLTQTPEHFKSYQRPKPVEAPDPQQERERTLKMARNILANRDDKAVDKNMVRWAMETLGVEEAKPGGG